MGWSNNVWAKRVRKCRWNHTEGVNRVRGGNIKIFGCNYLILLALGEVQIHVPRDTKGLFRGLVPLNTSCFLVNFIYHTLQ